MIESVSCICPDYRKINLGCGDTVLICNGTIKILNSYGSAKELDLDNIEKVVVRLKQDE